MFKEIIKNLHNLEDLLVECAEMCNITDGIGKLLMNKNEAYLLEKAENERASANITNCEMFRYLSATEI